MPRPTGPFLGGVQPVRWNHGRLCLIDQRRLPGRVDILSLDRAKYVAQAIKVLAVRGAPQIGICAAYGVALEARRAASKHRDVAARALQAAQLLAASRPTARDLFHACEYMQQAIAASLEAHNPAKQLLAAAFDLHAQDLRASAAMADLANVVFQHPGWVMTYCNTGALATGGGGTALAVICRGYELGLIQGVYVCETRPLLQGARLTAWELSRLGIPFRLLCDNAAASLLRDRCIASVITGADRVAHNGDTANKVGTRMLAVLAQQAGVPFYIAAPHTTFDHGVATGAEIPIEHRRPDEVTAINDMDCAPRGCEVYNPAFDVSEAGLIASFITDYGILAPSELGGSAIWN